MTPRAERRRRAMLLVPSVSEPSGVATYVAGIASAIEPTPCAVVAQAGSFLAKALPGSCELVVAPSGRWGLWKALVRTGRQFGFVQAHGPRALLSARLAGVPPRLLGYVFHEIEGAHGRAELLLARGLRLAGNAQATSAWINSQLDVEAAVLPPVVDLTDTVERADARRRLGLGAEETVIGVVGRLSPVKNPTLAVEAAALLRHESTVAFVGEGPEREALVAASVARGVRVHLPGAVADAGQLLSAFDVVLSCSPHETFGLAAAEAIVSGVPLVAVSSPGLRELANGDAGLRLVNAIPEQVAAAIDDALEQGPLDPALAQRILDRFGPQQSATRLREYYQQALTGSS